MFISFGYGSFLKHIFKTQTMVFSGKTMVFNGKNHGF